MDRHELVFDIATEERHKQIDDKARELRDLIKSEFEYLRRSVGQRFRWAMHGRKS